MTHECYKPTIEERVARLEDENVGMTNELYELQIVVDFLKIRIQTLEDLIIGDDK